jgi:hypothetical protein
MTPPVGQLWRVKWSGNLYRVTEIRPEAPNCYDRAVLELVSAADPLWPHEIGSLIRVELPWFEHVATLVEAAS